MAPDPSRPYQLTFENREGYLYASVTGERDNLAISLAIWREVAAEAERTDSTHILIEEDIKEGLTMGEVFQLASEIPRMGFAGRKVAFVDHELGQREIHDFGELVAVNRGWNGKVFNDVAEAEEWLRSG